MAQARRDAFSYLASLVHELSVLRHVAHATAAVKLHAIKSVLSEQPDIPFVVNVPPRRRLPALDAACKKTGTVF